MRLGVARRRDVDFEASFDGLRYAGRLDQMIDRHIYFLGCYAPDELAFLDRCASILRPLRPSLCFVDIGANVGQHSLFMSRRADIVFSFEPQRTAAGRLRENLRLNGIRNVVVSDFALGDEDGEATLGSGFDGNSGSRSLTWTLDSSKDTTVRVRPADAAFAELGIGRVDILKLDVEGFEKNVLIGMRERLTADRPVILFELIGEEIKGGFASPADLMNCLYDDHALFGLEGRAGGRLVDFDWSRHDEAVCVPRELASRFSSR